MSLLRLDKYLADAGYGTRSAVKELIKKSKVKINDQIVKKSDVKIDTEKDVVCVENVNVQYNEFEYFMLNKPQGIISASTDKLEKTVVDLITENKRRDLFPVGRLDKDTEGLLVITNDGKLANNLLSPTKHVSKTYYAIIDGIVSADEIEKFETGLDIGDDKPTKPAKLEIISVDENKTESEIKITITEGRYHQIKRMFEAVGMTVTFLKRLSMGGLFLDDNLKPGEYKKMSKDDLDKLKSSI